MSILQELAGYYARQDPGKVSGFGFAGQGVSFALVLDSSGTLLDVLDIRDTTGKRPRPVMQKVPRPVVRTVAIRPNFLWDKTAYVLGVKRRGASLVPAERERRAFVAFHRDLLGDAGDDGLRGVLRFLERWPRDLPDDARDDGPDGVLKFIERWLPDSDEIVDANLVFRLEGERRFVHDRQAARGIWLKSLDASEADRKRCLVTGEYAPIERIHPKIKGVRGAQTSGASIISFNKGAFTSFGRKQGHNAPVSSRAAFEYTEALNLLLVRGSRNRMQIGDTTTVFWADTGDGPGQADAAENLFAVMLQPDDREEAARIRDKLRKVQQGRPLREIEPGLHEGTRFFILGLAPNAARLSIRFWHQDTIGNVGQRLREHWQDLRIEPTPWRTPPAMWRLLRETAVQGKPENVPPVLAGALMRAVLTGSRYPRSLLTGVLLRIRADGKINGLRAAICKAYLARCHRLNTDKEDVAVSLDRDERNAGYRLGRLFAVYEGVQRAALGNVNATIADSFYGSASATPASVFPLLARKARHHLSSLRKKPTKKGLAHWFERQIDEIVDGFETAFPPVLGLEDQGRFAIGYHHQRSRPSDKSAEVSGAAKES